jgi:hypothetical protein
MAANIKVAMVARDQFRATFVMIYPHHPTEIFQQLPPAIRRISGKS